MARRSSCWRGGARSTRNAARLRAAAGLRNVLVHGYLDVDPARVWEHLGELDDLEAFARGVHTLLEA